MAKHKFATGVDENGRDQDRILEPLADEAGIGLVQLRPFVKVARDAFGDRRMKLLPQGGKPDKECPFY